jgi:hypothetical protein
MAKVVLPNYNPTLEPADIGRLLERQFAGKYQIEPSSSRFIDFKVFPSEWKGAVVRLKQDSEQKTTVIVVNGRVPHVWARLALVVIVWFPLVYADMIASRPVVKDIVNALETSPELGGTAGEPPSPPPPPPPPPGPPVDSG